MAQSLSLRFVAQESIYLPERDAVDITAVAGGRMVPCLATRAAMALLGCDRGDGPDRMIQKFEHHRPMLERAAAYKHRLRHHRARGAVTIDARDLCALFGFRGN